MNDIYAECLVSRGNDTRMTIAAVASAVGAAAGAVSVLFYGLIGFAIFVIMGALSFFAFQNKNVEYEYLMAGDEFSVDKILNKQRRKRLAVYALNDIQAVAPENSGRIKEFDRQVKQTSDYSSGNQSAARYAVIHQKAGTCTKLIIEPDEKMLRCFKMAMPRNFSEF